MSVHTFNIITARYWRVVMTTKSKLEYIWLDGFEPTQSMRSKTMIRTDFAGTVEECPMWSFDGSSTLQAVGVAFLNR